MIYIITNTKGGVGKTTTAINLASILAFKNRKFKLVELDSSNNSMIFHNSELLNDETAISLDLNQKHQAIGSMMFNLAKNKDMDFVIDLGGGTDSKIMIDSLKELESINKTWIIPTSSDKKYLQNASDTFEMINDAPNTYFILNKYHENTEEDGEDFMYFFGDKKLGVEPVSKHFKTSKYFKIPASPYFQLAEDDGQTLLDMALLSIQNTEAEASEKFIELAGEDEFAYISLWLKYTRSLTAAKLFNKIQTNAEILF